MQDALPSDFGVSPSTVGKHRDRVGLRGVARSVQRGAQTFEARYGSS